MRQVIGCVLLVGALALASGCTSDGSDASDDGSAACLTILEARLNLSGDDIDTCASVPGTDTLECPDGGADVRLVTAEPGRWAIREGSMPRPFEDGDATEAAALELCDE